MWGGGEGGEGEVGGEVADLLASILVSISQPLVVLWFLVLCGAGKQESRLFLFSRDFILRTSPFLPPPLLLAWTVASVLLLAICERGFCYM